MDAAAYCTYNRDFNSAILEYKNILILDPEKIFCNKQIGDLYLILKEYKLALFYYVRTYNKEYFLLSTEEKSILKGGEII